jgi:hypothetical protein
MVMAGAHNGEFEGDRGRAFPQRAQVIAPALRVNGDNLYGVLASSEPEEVSHDPTVGGRAPSETDLLTKGAALRGSNFLRTNSRSTRISGLNPSSWQLGSLQS